MQTALSAESDQGTSQKPGYSSASLRFGPNCAVSAKIPPSIQGYWKCGGNLDLQVDTTAEASPFCRTLSQDYERQREYPRGGIITKRSTSLFPSCPRLPMQAAVLHLCGLHMVWPRGRPQFQNVAQPVECKLGKMSKPEKINHQTGLTTRRKDYPKSPPKAQVSEKLQALAVPSWKR